MISNFVIVEFYSLCVDVYDALHGYFAVQLLNVQKYVIVIG